MSTSDHQWVVIVHYEKQRGTTGRMVSRPTSYTEAKRLVLFYEASGHQAIMREVRDLTEQLRKQLHQGAP